MAAAPLDSSSTPPGAAAATASSSDQTRFHDDSMEDTNRQSTRKRPRLDSGNGAYESWSTDEMSGRTVSSGGGGGGEAADHAEGEEEDTSRPANRVTINTKSPTEKPSVSNLDGPVVSSSSSTDPDPSSSSSATAPAVAQPAEVDTRPSHPTSISLSSSPAQSPEIEVADVDDGDQDGNMSSWKPLGDALRERVTPPEVVELHTQLSLTEAFPKLHENLGLRENLEDICSIIEKGSPHDITVFLAVKHWLDDVANNLDQLSYNTFADDREFWEDFPVVVEYLLRRGQDFQPDEGQGSWACLEEFFMNYGQLALHLVRLDTLLLNQSLDSNMVEPELMSRMYLMALGWSLQLNNIPLYRNMERIYGSQVVNLVSRVNDQLAAPPFDAMQKLTELGSSILTSIHRWPYLSHLLAPLMTVTLNMTESGNERRRYGADYDIVASPTSAQTAQAAYNLVKAVDSVYQAHITKKMPWITSDSNEPMLRTISLTYHALAQRDANLRSQLAKDLSIDLPEDAIPDECSLIVHYGWKFGALKKLIMDGRMELRVHGIEAMQQDLVNAWRHHIQNSPSGLQHPLAPFLIGYLRDNKIIEYIVGVDSHPQIISRSGNIIGFLIVTNNYTENDTDIIWETVTESQDSRTVSEILGILTRTFHMHPSTSPVLLNVCSKLLELPVDRFDARMIDFCDQLFHQIREKHGQRNNVNAMGVLHVDGIPLRLCVRLIRESVAVQGVSVEHKATLQRFGSAQLTHFSVAGLSEADKMGMYERCIGDIAEMNQFTVGSVQALNALLYGQDSQEMRKLAEEFDLTRLAIEEIAHAVRTNQTDFTDSFSRNGFVSRVQMLSRIIDRVPDTITAELGDLLWNEIFMSTALVLQGRRALWETLCGLAANGLKQNPFIERCIHEFIPGLSPEQYSPEVLSFAKQSIIYEIRFNPPPLAKENEVVFIPGMDRIWKFILTAPPNSIETAATNFAIDVYLDHNVIKTAPPSAVEATHISLVDRCVEQLKSAAAQLKLFNHVHHGKDESMKEAAPEDEIRSAEISFSRSLLFLRQLLQGLRIRPQYSPPQGVPPGLPGTPVKGEPLEIPYQSFNGSVQSKVQTLLIGDLSTASELADKITQVTGFSKFKTIYGGQKVDLLEKPDLVLRDVKLGSGLLLVRKEADTPELSPAGRRQSMTPVDSEVIKYFDDIYDLLNLEGHLAKEIYDFLVVFPPQDRVVELVKSQDKNEQDMFPMEKPYIFLYSTDTLSEIFREEAAKPSPEMEFASHSVYVLVSALTRPEMTTALEESPTKLCFATSLVECLILGLLAKPSSNNAPMFSNPGPLVQQLLYLMRTGRSVSSNNLPQLEIKKLICNSFAIMGECSVRDRGFWDAVKEHTQFDKFLLTFLLEENRQIIRKEISENMALLCNVTTLFSKQENSEDGQPMDSEASTKIDILQTIWDAFVQALPLTRDFAHQSQEFFDLAILVFSCAGETPAVHLDLGDYIKQWSTVMLSHDTDVVRFTLNSLIEGPTNGHSQFVGRESVDYLLLGFAKLLGSCLDRIQRAGIQVDTLDLASNLFDRYLFPDLSLPSDEEIVPQVPILHNRTRMEMYNILTMLIEDEKNYLSVVDNMEDLIPKGYTYTQAWCFDRHRMIRSAEGYAGLKNLSNTCYLNSLLTQLFMNVEFRDFMLQLDLTEPETSQKLLDETQKLFANMQETWLKSVDPQGLVDTIRTYENEPIDVTIQMDVDEFYNLLFDRWEGQVVDPEQKKKFRSFFGGQLVQQIKSKECPHISERLEPFSAIQCDIKGKASLEESLQAYVEGEIMQGDNKYSCTSCGRHVDAVKRACLKDVPNNLIFHLKRFDFDMITMMRNKINDEFQFPEHIDMSPFKVEYLSEQDNEVQPDIFELVGVLVHSGTAESGHYYSYVRERPTAGSSGSWVEFNDSDVSKFDESKIADQCFGGVNDSAVSGNGNVRFSKVWNAYMLFYQRVSGVDDLRSTYQPTKPNIPTTVPLPLALKNHIMMENEIFIRTYCLLDPYHAAFVQYVLSRLHDLKGSETVMKYKLDKSAVCIALDSMEQLISRSKDITGLDAIISELFKVTVVVPNGASRILEWAMERENGIRNLIFKSVHAPVRSGSVRVFVAALAKLHEKRDSVSWEDEEEKGKWQVRYLDAFEHIVTSLEDMWSVLHTASRSWDDYFEFLFLLANLGTDEVGILLDTGFLLRCLEIVWLDAEDPKRLKRQYVGYYRLVEKGRRFSHKKLMDFLSVLLTNINFAATPTAADERSSLPDGQYPLTATENEFIRPLGKNKELVVLKKILEQKSNPQASMTIVNLFMDAEPEAGLLDPICKVLEDGLRIAPAENCAPFLEATLYFCRRSPDEGRVIYLIDYVAKGVESINDSGGPAHLTFFTNLLNVQNERLGLDEAWFMFQMVEKIPDWAPTLLVYPENTVRRMTLELLRQTLFNNDGEVSDDWRARNTEIAKDLVRSCVQKLRRTYLSTPRQAIEAKIVEAIKTVIDHCLVTFFDETTEDQEFVQQAHTVSEAIEELSADMPEEIVSGDEWEDNSMIASDSEMGMTGSP